MNNATLTFGASQKEVAVGEIIHLAKDKPLALSCGQQLSDFPIAFQTYGELNADKSNAIFVCHALTGDQYVASSNPVTGKPGWWEAMIGPGKAVDTDQYFVICSNMLGGCMGSLGPKSDNPGTGKPYGLDFPIITISDSVNAQALLTEALGIEKLFAVVGGSMGGMQVLEWAKLYPNKMHAAVVLAASARQSAQNIAFHEIGRQAIQADPDWCGGNYAAQQQFPNKGLAVARMAAHVTYMSEPALQEKFGRNLQDRDAVTYGFEADFQVESYLRHQGVSFVERFDANSYLYLTRAASYFDITDGGKQLHPAFTGSPVRFCLVSFTSDWLYPTAESQKLARMLSAAGANVSFTEIESNKGHDAFLFDEPGLSNTIRGFLKGTARLQNNH